MHMFHGMGTDAQTSLVQTSQAQYWDFFAEDENMMLGRLETKLDGLRSIHYAWPTKGGKADDLTAAAVTANPFLKGRLAERPRISSLPMLRPFGRA